MGITSCILTKLGQIIEETLEQKNNEEESMVIAVKMAQVGGVHGVAFQQNQSTQEEIQGLESTYAINACAVGYNKTYPFGVEGACCPTSPNGFCYTSYRSIPHGSTASPMIVTQLNQRLHFATPAASIATTTIYHGNHDGHFLKHHLEYHCC